MGVSEQEERREDSVGGARPGHGARRQLPLTSPHRRPPPPLSLSLPVPSLASKKRKLGRRREMEGVGKDGRRRRRVYMDGNSLLACARGFLVCDLSLFLANVAPRPLVLWRSGFS